MTHQKSYKQHLPLLLLLATLFLAFALRFSRLDLAEFKSDEAGIARQALAVIHEREFPAAGPSSSQGPAHPPLQIYLLALPFAITRDPRLAVAVVALIHSAAVLMAYLLGARFFHRRVGLIAAFLFAVNPWAVYYARKMWTQNWPLATTLFVFCLFLLVVEGRRRALVGAGVALVALAGTHLGGLAFILVLLIVLFLFRSRVERRSLVIGSLVFLLFALPYLYHDATHDWESLRGFVDIGAGPVKVDLDAARFASWLSSGYHYQDLAGARYAQFLDGLPSLRWLDVIEMALLGLGVAYLVVRVISHARGGRERWMGSAGRDVVLLSWLVVPVLLQIRHSQPVYPHYFILLYPVQHLIIALLLSDGIDWLYRRFDRRLARWCVSGLVGLVIVIGGWQIYLEQDFIRFVARYDTPDGYGPVVGPLWRAASAAGEAASADGAEVLVVARGDNPVWDNVPAAFDVLLPRQLPHRFVDGQKALVFPNGPAVYIVSPEMEAVAAVLRGQTGAMLVTQIDAPGESPFLVFRRDNASRDDVLAGMTPLPQPRRLGNGVEMLAYRVGSVQPPAAAGNAPSGGTVGVTLAWWFDSASPPDADYHAFAHLVDAAGERRGQHDLSSFPSTAWQSGDLVLTHFQVQIDTPPPGEYWIRLGMYTYPDVVNVPVVDVAGNPAADAVLVGPISLP